MPRKKRTDDQPVAEPVSDAFSQLVLWAKELRKEPTEWAMNGLREALPALVNGESGDLDTLKEFDQALRVFKGNRSQAAADLLLSAAQAYQITFVTKSAEEFAKKFGLPTYVPELPETPSDDTGTE